MPCSLPRHWNAHVRRPHARIVVQAYYASFNGNMLRLQVDAHFTVLVPVNPRVTLQLVQKLCRNFRWGTELMQIGIRPALSLLEKEQAMEALLPIIIYGRLANTCPLNTTCNLLTLNQQALVSTILFLPVDSRWALFPHIDVMLNYGRLSTHSQIRLFKLTVYWVVLLSCRLP